MSLITILWSMAASACLTLAALHFYVWCRQPRSLAYLFYSLCAVSITGVALCELQMMFAKNTTEYAQIQRLAHFPVFAVVLTLVAFVFVHFRRSLLWLGLLAVGMRLVSLVLNVTQPVSLNFQAITELRFVRMLGEIVAYPVGVSNPLVIFGQASSVFLLLFAADASVRSWRQGQKQTAILVGGSIVLFVLIAAGHSALINSGLVASPYFVAMPFLATALAMGTELSSGIVKSAQLGKQLQASQADLKKTEQRLSVAADAANLGLWTWDICNDRVWMNENCAVMLGISTTEPISLESFLVRVHAQDREHVAGAVNMAIATSGNYQCEFRVGQSTDSERWFFTRGRIETSPTGEAAYLHGACSDITERRQSAERFRVVFESAPNGLIITEPNGSIVLANGEAERMFGYPGGALNGCSITELTGDFAFSRPTVKSGDPSESTGYRLDRTSFPITLSLKAIRTASGSVLLASITDLTDRNERERLAALQRSEIAHLSRITMLGEVSGSIAHELNQPLTAILTNAETAQRFLAATPANVTEVDEILHDIVDDATRAAEVIRLVRLLQKKSETDYQEVDLHEVVGDAMRILRSEAASRNITINLNLNEALPLVRGDKVQLQQVMINLVLNAYDAVSGTGDSPRVIIVETSSEEENMLSVSVRDSGPGLNARVLQCMFEPFFTSKPNGLGLGLAICKTIVEVHKGKLVARNNDEAGATIAFSLPRSVSQINQGLSISV